MSEAAGAGAGAGARVWRDRCGGIGAVQRCGGKKDGFSGSFSAMACRTACSLLRQTQFESPWISNTNQALTRKDHHRTPAQLMARKDQALDMSNSSDQDSHLDTSVNSKARARRHEEQSEGREGAGHEQENEDITIDTEGDPDQDPGSLASLISSTPIKRPKRNPSVKCPICHEIVPPGQYQQHYRMELAQLESCVLNDKYDIALVKRLINSFSVIMQFLTLCFEKKCSLD